MKFRTILCLTLACTLAAAGSVWAIARSGSFTEIITQESGKDKLTTTTRVQFAGDKIRFDVESATKPKQVVIADGKSILIYYPEIKKAYRATPKGNAVRSIKTLVQMAQRAARGKVRTGSEKISGYPCSVFTHKRPGSPLTMKFWISQDPDFPLMLKQVVSVPKMKDMPEQRLTRQIVNVRLGHAIPDSVFVLPKGTPVLKEDPMAPKVHEPSR